jgi:hypothetical protein
MAQKDVFFKELRAGRAVQYGVNNGINRRLTQF